MQQLEEQGYVSRNQALSRYISRLAARIADLEEEGYVFKAEQRGSDYVYKLVSAPAPKQLTLV